MGTTTVGGRIVIEGHATPEFRQLWRVVDGAVRDAMSAHPGWLASEEAGVRLRNSIVKRAVGQILSYAEHSAKGRSWFSQAAIEPEACYQADGCGDSVGRSP